MIVIFSLLSRFLLVVILSDTASNFIFSIIFNLCELNLIEKLYQLTVEIYQKVICLLWQMVQDRFLNNENTEYWFPFSVWKLFELQDDKTDVWISISLTITEWIYSIYITRSIYRNTSKLLCLYWRLECHSDPLKIGHYWQCASVWIHTLWLYDFELS